MKSTYILGITGLSQAFHDNSAVLTKNGSTVFAASEERYSRIKHDRNFPILSIKEAFKFAHIFKSNIKFIAIGYPRRKFLQPFAGKDLNDFLITIINWIKGRGIFFILDAMKILFGEVVQNSRGRAARAFIKNKQVVYIGHHLSHAASAYFVGGFDKCLAVSMDAFGPTISGQLMSGEVYLCENNKIKERLEQIDVKSSIGLFYTSVTQALGFTPGDGEGKTMGLAAYGNPKVVSKSLRKIAPFFKDNKWCKVSGWPEMFFSTRKEFRPIFNSLPIGKVLRQLIKKYGWENVAAGAQLILEEEVIKYFEYLVSKYKVENFALAGGLFLNVKMNKKIAEINGIKNIFVQPNAGDGGTALGAAMQLYSEKVGFKKLPQQANNVSWGSGYTTKEIERALKAYGKQIIYKKYKDVAKLTAGKLLEGKVIGWFQGRFEWGPRALGYRSVLIDPRRMDIKDRLNNTLKNREWFMPFAPSIMEEYGNDYFLNYEKSPFMTTAFDVKRRKVKILYRRKLRLL
ncbi:MAG: hypothetical protein UU06_C0028G0003 [Parcubacteria group bacterium GW2011_GWB1_40_5]|nr:MAG: hypothetical protein UU06_C0028G0003 [Parcubacteria group bacterium GW2011_GWB1_40_5]